jgi:hypothetical protein
MRGWIQCRFRVGALVFSTLLLVLAAGCGPLEVGLKQARDLASDGKDVAFAIVDSNGHVYPKTLIVRKEIHKILWLADADTLTVTFPDGTLTPICHGPLCFTLVPSAVELATDYTGSVTKSGSTKPLDPRLEVVK